MPQKTFTADEWLRGRPSAITADDYLASRPRIFTSEDWLQQSSALKKKQEEENHETIGSAIGSVLEQAGYGFLESASFGLINKPETMKPRSPVAGVAGSVGSLAGLLIGPGKLMKPLQMGLRAGAMKTVPRLLGRTAAKVGGRGAFRGGYGAGRIAAHMGSEAAGMAILGAVSDLDASSPEMQENIKGFGVMGAVFGAAKMIHIPAHPVLGWVLRQAGTRGLMAAAGQYPEGYLTKDNLPGIVWQEALNTVFTMKGVSPREIISGKYNDPMHAKMVAAITDAVNKATAPPADSPIAIAKQFFTKPVKQQVDFKDIIIDQTKVTDAERTAWKAKLSLKKGAPVELEFNPQTGKYSTDKYNSALAAIHDINTDRMVKGEKLIDAADAFVVQDGKYANTRLIRPMELAYKLVGADQMEQKVIDEFESSDMILMEVTKKSNGKLRAIGDSREHAPIKVGPNQVLWQFDPAIHDYVPIVVGENLKGKLAWGKKEVPTEDLYNTLSAMRNKQAALQTLAESGETKAGFAARMLQGKINKLEKALEREADTDTIEFEGMFEDKGPERGVFNLKVMHKNVTSSAKLIKSMPEQPMPKAYQIHLANRYDNLRLGTADITSLYESLKIDKGGPRLKHLTMLEAKLRQMEQADPISRMNILLEDWLREHDINFDPLEGEHGTRQETSELVMRQRVKMLKDKAYQEYRKDPTGKSPLSNLMTGKFIGSWADVRYNMMNLEEKTGIPFFRLYRMLSQAESKKKFEHAALMREINEYSNASAEDQRAVRMHYDRMLRGEDAQPEILTDYQQGYVKAIDTAMGLMRGDVFDYKFRMWIENVKRPRLADEAKAAASLKPVADELLAKKYPRVFRSQDSEAQKKLLDELYQNYVIMSEKGGPQETRQRASDDFEALKKVAMEQYSLGLIREDAYLPEIFSARGTSGLTNAERLMNIDVLGKGHTKIKMSKDGKEIDVDEMLLGAHDKEQNLARQLENYTNQILNLKYLDKPLSALDALGDIFNRDMREAKPAAFMRQTEEAKAYSLYDFLKLYSTRLKGFPIKIGGLGRALKATQAVFFRSLTVRPMLIVRNFPQRFVTPLGKEFVLDPKYFGKKFHFDKLPENVQEWFDTLGVNELEMIKNQFLEIQTDFKWAKTPILGTLWKWSGEVGKLYAQSDLYNRRYVFSKTWFKSNDIIKSYRDGAIDMKTMEAKVKVHKMRPLEQREFRESIQAGEDAKAAFINARFQTVNSQWYYGRHERSFQEMTAEGETYTNLLTWSKSMAQQTYNTYERITDGYKRYKILSSEGKTAAAAEARDQALGGVAQVAGLAIAGGISNIMLNTISLNHKGRYQAYGFDMFTWEMGGVTQEILTQFTTGLADFVSSFDGTADDKKKALDALWKMGDNVAIRQLFPFAKSALSVMEAFTGRSYMSPVYEFFSKYEYGYPKGVTNVNRTFLERFMHGIFSQDPNKSNDVKLWAWQHYKDMQIKAANETNPALKAYDQVMLEKYKYFNDLFQRYTPYEAAKIRDRHERVVQQQSLAKEIMQYEYNIMKQGYKQ